jgi:hypothetical protein
MRFLAALAATLFALAAAGCGGSDGDDSLAPPTNSETTVSAPSWAAPLLAKPGPESALVLATSDFSAGANRVGFLLVRGDGSLVTAPTADLYYGPGKRTTARLVDIGTNRSSGEREEVKQVYVARLPLQEGDKQWIVVQPRGVPFQGYQLLDVKKDPVAIGVGDEAPASDTPTTATHPANRITTAKPPDLGLLRYSVKDSVVSGKPFVVAFATPAYCQSRTCGPTVDVVDEVRKRFEDRGVRFIHVEIYEDNLPGNGVNEWVRQWKLPSEPWVFVVGADGVVKDRFEGALSVGELSASVQKHLLGGS